MNVTKLIKCNGYEARQTSLLYVFVIILGPDPAQVTIGFEYALEQLTNRNVPVNISSSSVMVKSRDCARELFFQYKLKQHCYQL